MHKVSRNLSQRYERKPALMQQGVRHGKPVCRNQLVIAVEYIYVDEPCPPFFVADTAQFLLNSLRLS